MQSNGFNFFFNFFDAIYCINLNERKDRLELAYKEFESLGITEGINVISAVKNEIGCRGCLESHILIIKKAKEMGLKNILVLEDDVVFLEKDMDYYKNMIEEVKALPEFHLLYLGANTIQKLSREGDFLLKAKECLTTHAICYNFSIYDKIISDYDNNKIHILDAYLRHEIQPMNKSYISNRLCATQRNGYSDIEKKDVNYVELIAWRFNYWNHGK